MTVTGRVQDFQACLTTLERLAQDALEEAERTAASVEDSLQSCSRTAAYIRLRNLHKNCSECRLGMPCSKGRAKVMIRDLLALAVCTDGCQCDKTFRTLKEALMAGCNWDRLNKEEQSELTFGSKTREIFDKNVPHLTDEDVEAYFVQYSSISRRARRSRGGGLARWSLSAASRIRVAT